MCVVSIVSTQAATITAIRIADNQHKARIVLELSSKTHFNAFALYKPNRLVVDLQTTRSQVNISNVKLKNTPVKRIRHGKNKHDLRLVFDLYQHYQVHAFMLKPDHQYPYRLVIDLKNNIQKIAKPKVVVKSKPVVTVPKRRPLRDLIVVIDPGHGGKDPGALGSRGTHEKQVVLAIAKDLRHYLNRVYGINAILTRNGDYYIGLRRRLNITRKHNADLFIAIHADAFKKPSSKGASVFVLSQRGASSEAARWLAERENYSELGDASLRDKSDLVRSVLIDLSQTATILSSLQLGEKVLKYLSHITKLHARKVEQARFVVLKSPDIPSVLIETGFISNHQEELRLRSPLYRRRLAKAIVKGVVAYFNSHAPDNTYYTEFKRRKKYHVRRGDNLVKIAHKFHTTVRDIKHKNNLKNVYLRVGQELIIS